MNVPLKIVPPKLKWHLFRVTLLCSWSSLSLRKKIFKEDDKQSKSTSGSRPPSPPFSSFPPAPLPSAAQDTSPECHFNALQCTDGPDNDSEFDSTRSISFILLSLLFFGFPVSSDPSPFFFLGPIFLLPLPNVRYKEGLVCNWCGVDN